MAERTEAAVKLSLDRIPLFVVDSRRFGESLSLEEEDCQRADHP